MITAGDIYGEIYTKGLTRGSVSHWNECKAVLATGFVS